jgi:hypothetical protein
MDDQRAGFAGVYGPTANIAWQAVATFDPAATLADPLTMHRFVGSLCDSIPILNAPEYVWQITRGGCAVVEPPGGAQ